MNIDDRPTTDLRAYSHILAKFQMAITLQRVNRSPSCLVLGWGFGDGGSNGAISGWIKFKMAAGGHLGKLQTAISQQCIIRYIEEERKRPWEIAEKTAREEYTLDCSQSKVFLVILCKCALMKSNPAMTGFVYHNGIPFMIKTWA